MSAPRLFIPFTKVDATQRIVYGTFTEEAVDRSNEIMDYTSSKPNFEKWSESLYKASEGKNYGNVRAMHKAVAAGKFVEPIHFDDQNKVMKCAAKIVDNDEWDKVQEGVYTGFSVGGAYAKRWTDTQNPSAKRYTALPSEVSLVDLPCAVGATFELIKEGGTAIEHRLFKSVVTGEVDFSSLPELVPVDASADTTTGSQASTTGEPISKAAGTTEPNATAPAADPAAASTSVPASLEPEPVFRAKDGTIFTKAAEAVTHNAQLEATATAAAIAAPATEALARINKVLGEPAPSTPATPAAAAATDPASSTTPAPVVAKAAVLWGTGHFKALAKDTPAGDRHAALAKGMWDISRIASLLCEMKWLYECMASEEAIENDGSANPGKTASIITAMVDLLTSVVAEETSELLATVKGDGGEADDAGVTVVLMAAHMPENLLKAWKATTDVNKVAALHNALDTELAQLEVQAKLAKSVGLSFKEEDLRPDNFALPDVVRQVLVKSAGLEKVVETVTGQMTKLAERVEALAAQPEPFRGVYKTLSKSADASAAMGGEPPADTRDPNTVLQETLAKMSPEQRSLALMKFSLANPVVRLD